MEKYDKLIEENKKLKRENFAYYDKSEREPINPLEQSNIDYEKEIKKLKEIIQILLD